MGNDPEFEKIDDWMMGASKPARENKISQKELDALHDGVMKKIVERQRPSNAIPFGSFIFAAGFTLAVLIAVGFYIRHTPPKHNTKVQPSPGEIITPQIPPRPVPGVGILTSQAAPQVKSEIHPPAELVLKDQDIMAEIEALKELGVWNEQDEEEAGIPFEVTFSDLDIPTQGEKVSPLTMATRSMG